LSGSWARLFRGTRSSAPCSGTRPLPMALDPDKKPSAASCSEPHLAGLARLEPHSRSRRNVEEISGGCVTIECERGVGLGEMKVTADLNRSVARVRDREHNGRPVRIQDNLAGSRKQLPRYHASV